MKGDSRKGMLDDKHYSKRTISSRGGDAKVEKSEVEMGERRVE